MKIPLLEKRVLRERVEGWEVKIRDCSLCLLSCCSLRWEFAGLP